MQGERDADRTSIETDWLSNNEVERLLLEQPDDPRLLEHLGEREARSLARRAHRTVRVRSRGVRVIILPGIQGSWLGTPRAILGLWPDIAWIGPRAAIGKLRELSLGRAQRKHMALGVIERVYFRLMYALRERGLDASCVAYDWRDCVATCADALVREIERERRPVRLVGHSMGGLVALHAAQRLPTLVERVVLVGTPLQGSMLAPLTLRGMGISRLLSRVDLTSDASELGEVWASFPSIYDLFPAASLRQRLERALPESTLPVLDPRDANDWPAHMPTILPSLLTSTRPHPKPDARCAAIVGTNLPTVVRVRVAPNGAWITDAARIGDGVVASASAHCPGATHEARGVSHVGLVRQRACIEAIGDLVLGRGTSALPAARSRRIARSRQLRTLDMRVRCVKAAGTRHIKIEREGSRQAAAFDDATLLATLNLSPHSRRPRDIARTGMQLTRLLGLTSLVRGGTAPVVLRLDAESSVLPWEALRPSRGEPAWSLEREVVRVLDVEARERTRSGADQRALVIADPTGDLPEAAREGAALAAIMHEMGIDVRVLRGGEATRTRVLDAIADGVETVHFAGHGHFDQSCPARSGLSLADGVLLASDVKGLPAPSLLVLNACESARTRAGAISRPLRALAAHAGLAETLLRAGIPDVVGTMWPVLDESAGVFARAFWEGRARGEDVSRAVLRARRVLAASPREGLRTDSVNYAHYVAQGAASGTRTLSYAEPCD